MKAAQPRVSDQRVSMGGLHRGKEKLTSVNVFGDEGLQLALVCSLNRLRLKLRAVHEAHGVHGTLQRVVDPAEDVVAVLAISGAVRISQS